MTSPFATAPAWRDLEIGLVLPDRAFGSAVEVEGLLEEPDLHYSMTLSSSRLLLMPRAGSFTRLSLEWQTLPEVGVFTAGYFPSEAVDEDASRRLETWMREVASTCHALRGRIRESAERVVRDATEGTTRSMPDDVPAWAHLVTTHVGSRIVIPDTVGSIAETEEGGRGRVVGVVDVDGPSEVVADDLGATVDEWLFRERATGVLLGRRRVERLGDEIGALRYDVRDTRATIAHLEAWFEQHIVREVLFDDVWQVYVHLLAGLEAPLNVAYFS